MNLPTILAELEKPPLLKIVQITAKTMPKMHQYLNSKRNPYWNRLSRISHQTISLGGTYPQLIGGSSGDLWNGCGRHFTTYTVLNDSNGKIYLKFQLESIENIKWIHKDYFDKESEVSQDYVSEWLKPTNSSHIGWRTLLLDNLIKVEYLDKVFDVDSSVGGNWWDFCKHDPSFKNI